VEVHDDTRKLKTVKTYIAKEDTGNNIGMVDLFVVILEHLEKCGVNADSISITSL
jgi:hypothetical protein